jgi:hypothetical protein
VGGLLPLKINFGLGARGLNKNSLSLKKPLLPCRKAGSFEQEADVESFKLISIINIKTFPEA